MKSPTTVHVDPSSIEEIPPASKNSQSDTSNTEAVPPANNRSLSDTNGDKETELQNMGPRTEPNKTTNSANSNNSASPHVPTEEEYTCGDLGVQPHSPPRPVIAPRSSSLKEDPRPTIFESLLNHVLKPSVETINDDVSPESRIKKNRLSVAAMRDIISHQEELLSQLDNTTHQMTLESLESENAKLMLDPKTILASAGSYRTTSTTLQGLTETLKANDQDIEFWNGMMSDYSELVKKIPQPKIWMTICDAQPERMGLLYPGLVNEESPFERIIKRDLPRTFPKVDMFKDPEGDGQKMLFNLLKAYSIYDSEVGYCQGLSFVVGPLLMQNVSEVDAFSILVRLMEEDSPHTITASAAKVPRPYALRSLFTSQMVGLHLLLYQHTCLVRSMLPRLSEHFTKYNVNASMYASQWFLTIYAYNFPFNLVFRIFDIIFAEGALTTILRFSISMLKRNEEQLLARTEFEDILNYLKGESLSQIYANDYEMAVRDAMNETDAISDSVLEELKRRYDVTVLKAL
ncbi:MAG: hypothetical protein SGCHY_000605 [Lobulomycetales sp.]